MAHELLSEAIRKFIYRQGWESLRPIQTAAIERIMSTDAHCILASPTASGKTEAAFLPILSKVNFEDAGVQVLYISPLIALINDQFERVLELCRYLDVRVTKWHGEANVSEKKQLEAAPSGIVLITPESIEAMFVHQPKRVKKLFGQLKFVVIDEIHAFLGTERGRQLQSLIARLQQLQAGEKFRIIGLSATIGNYEAAKEFTGNAANTKVLLDRGSRKLGISGKYFAAPSFGLSTPLLKDIYLSVEGRRALIFPNSRARVEEISQKLKRLNNFVRGKGEFLAHHAEIAKTEREQVEIFAKTSGHSFFSIVCTSTLELGIDIGSIELVVQVDAPYSVASLVQRVGRSGRRGEKPAELVFYATTPISLLQSLAALSLYAEDFIEPIQVVAKPFDILAHQILSIIKAQGSLTVKKLTKQILDNSAFSQISTEEIAELLAHLLKTDMLELLDKEFILGLAGEAVVNKRDFYALFHTEQTAQIVFDGDTIGEISYLDECTEGYIIALSGQNWQVQTIDNIAKKIFVKPTKLAADPPIINVVSHIHPSIRQKMFDLAMSQTEISYLNPTAASVLADLRKSYGGYPISDRLHERPMDVLGDETIVLHSFSGCNINRTLQLMFQLSGYACQLDDRPSQLTISGISEADFLHLWEDLAEIAPKIVPYLTSKLSNSPEAANFSKFAHLLGEDFQARLLSEKDYDIPRAVQFVANTFWRKWEE